MPLGNPKPGNAHDELFTGRLLSPELNLDLPTLWLGLCENNHGPKCQPSYFDPAHAREIGLRMVDVERECVVLASAACRYAALSYVWGEGGDRSRFLLTDSTSWRLGRPGGLSSGYPDTPRTFVEAITLVRRLGFAYLWIDAVCIKQDDKIEMAKQMNCMDMIYACAALTVASDASSAHAGIPGVCARSRDPKQLLYRGEHIDLIAPQNGPFHDLGQSPWSRRAWTFQEDVLSKALLVLAHDQAYYLCRSAAYREDLVTESTKLNVVPTGFGNDKQAERWQFRQVEGDIDQDELFLHRVELFTKRNLTYQQDALNAFAGVSASLFPCHFGLPNHLFTAIMNWTFRLRSRVGARNTSFPSWSWAGWKFGETGVVGGEWFIPRHAAHYPRSSPDYDIQWYEVESTGNLRLVSTESSPLSSYDGPDAPLLAGYQAGHVYESPMLQQSDISTNISNHPLRKHLLLFWAIGAYLAVSREPEPREHPLWKQLPPDEPIDSYRIHFPGSPEKLLGHVSLDRAWRAHQPVSLYFFIVSRHSGKGFATSPAFNAMLVEFEAGIAYRVQVSLLSAGGFMSSNPAAETRSMWLDAKPAWRLIAMA